jgi:hypothetical protein
LGPQSPSEHRERLSAAHDPGLHVDLRKPMTRPSAFSGTAHRQHECPGLELARSGENHGEDEQAVTNQWFRAGGSRQDFRRFPSLMARIFFRANRSVPTA